MPVLFLSVVVDLVGFGIMLPLLPYYAEHYGASPLAVTLLHATFALAQFVSAPFWGRLSDRIGRRPVFLVCLAGSVVAYAWLAVAETLIVLFAARALSGIAAGKIAVAQAIVADITPPERRARGMGLIGAAFGIGMVLGPALGGLLAGGGDGTPRFHISAWAAAGASALALVLAFATVRESLPAPRAGGNGWTTPVGALRDLAAMPRALLLLAALFFVVNLVFSQIEATFPLWVERRFAWGPLETGVVFTFIGVVVASVQGLLIGPMTRRLGEARLAGLGMALLATGMLVVPAIVGLGSFAASTALVAFGFASINAPLSALVSRAAAATHQGAALGAAQGAGALGRVLGPGLAGWLFETFGRDAPAVSGGIVLALTLLAVAWRRRNSDNGTIRGEDDR